MLSSWAVVVIRVRYKLGGVWDAIGEGKAQGGKGVVGWTGRGWLFGVGGLSELI